jgi:RNA polymerase sigma-54 factor
MALELKQNLKLTQQLVMTPQLQQAIKLLQLSRLELVEQINQELEENPILEEITSDDEEIETEHRGEDAQPDESTEFKQIDRPHELTGEGDGRDEFDWKSYIEDYGPMGNRYDLREENEVASWDNMLTKRVSLMDHLMWQLKLSRFTELEMKIGEQIIGNIDQSGYFRYSVEEIAKQEDADIALVEDVLRKIQGFDPPGIAARDLKECLLIQYNLLGVNNPIVEIIIKEHLRDLEKKSYTNIAKRLHVPLSEVLRAVLAISDMDPKPGDAFNEGRVEGIIPDVYVFKSEDEYKIIMNDDGLPRLRISNFYKEVMAGLSRNHDLENGKKFIRDKVQSATWLIKSIQQRQKTIYKVAESIVKNQRDFFDKGIEYLKPLILKDIADDVNVHESTISRVVTNKYMHTIRGIFELKYFFSSSIHKAGGDFIASKSVKEAIKKIIGEEDHKKPLSDQEIVKILKQSGIIIARRTVAKYREMTGILSTSKRKKYF